MKTEILIILTSAFAALTWVRILPFIYYIKLWLGRPLYDGTLKPLDCVFCLSGWFTLALTLIAGCGWVSVLFATTFAPFVGMIVEHLFDLYIKSKLK